VKLLGEEVDSEIAMLASLGRSGDADDLARAALQDQEVANADVVARDGDGVRPTAAFNVADILEMALTNACGATLVKMVVVVVIFSLLDYYFLALAFVVRMERVEDAVRGFLNAVTERVVLTFVVVVAHA